MRRIMLVVLSLTLVTGCQSHPEPVPVPPVLKADRPENFAVLVNNARLVAMAATEAFYVDNWSGLEENAKRLEAIVAQMPLAPDLTEPQRKDLVPPTQALILDARALAQSARDRNARQVNGLLQRLHSGVRLLRLDRPGMGN
jgi:hypothetical protein